MSTAAPSKVQEFDAKTIEKIAYNSAAEIPTREPNDQYRLGYSVWLMLNEKNITLEQAIKNSGARLLIGEKETAKKIAESLRANGIEVK